MDIVQVQQRQISGICVRTDNADEMNPETSKIAELYKMFDENVVVNYRDGDRVYGVYFNYESDASGQFSVLAGAERAESQKLELEKLTIPSGEYMVFKGRGAMPQAVIDTWTRIWDFFSSSKPSHLRAYTMDFEYYISPTEVDIYIAIK